MHFQIKPMEDVRGDSFTWKLCKADGTALAAAPVVCTSEAEAREQIAALRKSAGGMKFAKVLDA